MKRKTLSVVLAIIIVLSASVVAVIHRDLFTATGQSPSPLNPYAVSPSVTPVVSPVVTPVVTPTITPTASPTPRIPGSETPVDTLSDLTRFEADGFITYEFENFRLVHDTNTGVWWLEWDITNNLNVPMTIQPYIALYGCDVSRTGTEPNHLPIVFAGEAGSCPARSPSLNLSVTLTTPSVAAGTHHSTATRLNFQGSTLGIPSEVTTSNATGKTIVGKSIRDKYVAKHPEAATKKKTDTTVLRQRVCTVDSAPIGVVNGTSMTLQPGESATVRSTVDSSDWGFDCAPVSQGLINYNVQAGGSSYRGLTVDQTIVFGGEESNICG